MVLILFLQVLVQIDNPIAIANEIQNEVRIDDFRANFYAES